MRRILPNTNLANNLTYTAANISQDIRYTLITPFVGGGTESYKNDQHTLVRVSSIRGVLRFWWRATRGGLSRGDARHLRRLEARIWGGNCREYTATAKIGTTPVQTNGQSQNGVFTHIDGFEVQWAGDGIITVQYTQHDAYVFHDVILDEKGEHNIYLRNTAVVEIIRADFVDYSLAELVVVVNGNQYNITCTQQEVMHPAKVKMHVVSYITDITDKNVINENHPGRTLLPGANDDPIKNPQSDLSYVLFPLRNVTNARIHTGVTFTLHIEYPNGFQADVEAALWAWEHFGGLGARTRRGLGAIERLNNLDQPIKHGSMLRDRLEHGLALHVVDGIWPKHTPHISSVTFGEYGGTMAASIFFDAQPVQSDARTVWGNLFKKYRDFRQHRMLRNGNPRGENIWPEPNSLRQMENAPLRSVPAYVATRGFQSHFPRAQMGMPVEYSFPAGKFRTTIDSTYKRTVNIRDMHTPEKEGRFASPVIFRPIRDGNDYRGILVILGGSRAPVTAYINQTPVDVYGNPGMTLLDRDGNPHGPTTTDDVLQGLFNFFK